MDNYLNKHFEKHLEKLHRQIAYKDDINTAIIYSLRHWLAFRLQPGRESANSVYIERAYHGAMAAYRRNEPHVRLFSLAIFMAIEAGHYNTAAVMLDSTNQYRSFLKANEPFYYGAFRFLRSYLAFKQGKTRAGKKHRKAFMAYRKTVAYSPHHDVMLGQLNIAAQEYPQAYEALARAYNNGCRSVYIYESIYTYYKVLEQGELTAQLDLPDSPDSKMLNVLVYAAVRGANISAIATAYEGVLYDAVKQNPAMGERLYNLSRHPSLLKAICSNKMEQNDYSLKANKLYRLAAENQVRLGHLEVYLLKSSQLNRMEKISTYTLGQFLQSNIKDMELTIYALYLLLTDPAHARLRQSHKDKIMQTAANALASGIASREANALYQFYWERNKEARAGAILEAGLTQYQVTPSPGARYIYISHLGKRGMDEYEFPADGTPILIDAGYDFSHISMGAGKRQIAEGPVSIQRVLPLANPKLYQHFFDKGDRRYHVVAYLAAAYLKEGADEKNEHSAPVFEAMLEVKALHKPYRTKILTALGHLYHQKGDNTRAMACYAEIDMHNLNGADIQKILEVYLEKREYDSAAGIIASHHSAIPTQAVYEGLRQLVAADYTNPTGDEIATAAYNLLIAGYIDEPLLDLVLRRKSSLSELKALSAALENKFEDKNLPSYAPLDTKILSTALWMHQYDSQVQRAFRRLHVANLAQKECGDFVELLVYAILTQSFVPDYDTITALEKIYPSLAKGDNPSKALYLLISLCHLYLHHKVITLQSDKIIAKGIAAQEAAGILLPIFKENKPYPHPYLEKYQPFLYQGQPDKNIHLNYRIGQSEGDFTRLPMEYLSYGLYTAKLPLFYNETVTYYYSDEMPTGSIATPSASHKNTVPYLCENHPDMYFAINNAIIYEQMFRHELVEGILDGMVGEGVEACEGLML